ncbi:hypothetical protein ACOSQ3_019964 [Xanthoceras sorbifolium]
MAWFLWRRRNQILFEEFLDLKSDMWVAAGKFLLDFVGAAGVFSAGVTARSAVVAIVHSDAAACVADSGAIFLPFGVAVGCPAVASVGCLAGAAVAGSSVGVVVLSDAAAYIVDSGVDFQPAVVAAGCPAVAVAVYIAGAVIGVPLFAAVNPAGAAAAAYFSSPCASSATASSSSFVVVACPAGDVASVLSSAVVSYTGATASFSASDAAGSSLVVVAPCASGVVVPKFSGDDSRQSLFGAAQDNRWVPPVCGSFKLNVDAAFDEACGKFGLGMAVHDSLGCLCFAAAVSCSGHVSVELQKPSPSLNVTNWQSAGV